MADVALVSPLKNRSNKRKHPITFMGLAAYLEKNGIKTDIIDIKTKFESHLYEDVKENYDILVKELLQKLKESQPKMIGLTAFTIEVLEVLELSRVIKTKFDVPIVVGGPHATLFPKEFLFENSPVDYVVIGEGELTLLDLYKAITGNKDIRKVKGIAYYDNGKVKENERRLLIHDLSIIPKSPFHKINMGYYTKPEMDKIRPVFISSFYVLASIGCPSKCIFCCTKHLWDKNNIKTGYVRYRNMDDLLSEIELLSKKYKADSFSIVDDTFMTSKKYVMEFCRRLKEKKLNLIWCCQARVNQVDREVIREIKSAGCFQIEYGVEAGNQKMLNRLKKGITIKQIKEAFRLSREAKIRTFANLMINLPGETKEDINDLISLCEEIDADVYGFGICTPFPGTDLFNELKLNITPEDYHKFGISTSKVVDKRFIMATHSIDIDQLFSYLDKRFNPLSKRLSVIFNKTYLRQLLLSRRKKEYIIEALYPIKKILLNLF